MLKIVSNRRPVIPWQLLIRYEVASMGVGCLDDGPFLVVILSNRMVIAFLWQLLLCSTHMLLVLMTSQCCIHLFAWMFIQTL